jgi:starch synthase
MVRGMPRPNAAIYYATDAFDTSRPRLMGRHAAGEGFLRGFVRHGGADRLYCYAASEAEYREFTARTKAHGAVVPTSWIPFTEPQGLREPGCLFYPTVGIDQLAWLRRRHDQQAYSLVGITHTIVTGAVIEVIANWLIAPVQPWDAVICTSRAVREVVDRVIEAQAAYLESRLGPVRRNLPQLPVIRSGSIATPTPRRRRCARAGASGSASRPRMSPSCFSAGSAFTARRIRCRCIAGWNKRWRSARCRRVGGCI